MATPTDYQEFLKTFVQGDTFAQADEVTQQKMLKRVRDEFKVLTDEPSAIDAVTADVNKEYRQSNMMGRYIPTGVEISGPWDEGGFEELSEEEKVAKIEEFRTRVPELAAQDDLNYDDTKYYLNRVVDEQKRVAQGENTGWVEDKGWRLFDGFAAGIASKLGQQDTADSIRAWSETNPKYDTDFGAQLAQGVGDIGASTAIFLGATAVSGGNVGVGSAALLGANGVERYTTTYRDAIEKGMSAEQANAAGVGALPGAVVDFFGDRLLAGKFLPKNYDELLRTGSLAAKKTAIAEIFANNELRKHAIKMARDFAAQGLSEAGGDWTSGYGAYIATGDESFQPSVSDLKDSFLIGGVIGAGMSGIESYRDRRATNTIADNLQKEVSNEEATESAAASVKDGQMVDADAKIKTTSEDWDRFRPKVLPELKPEELLPKATATPEEIDAFEQLESPGKDVVLEVAAHEELTAFGRPKGVVNNYGEKIRADFTNVTRVEPSLDVTPTNEDELKAVDPEAIPLKTIQPIINNEIELEALIETLNDKFGVDKWSIGNFRTEEKVESYAQLRELFAARTEGSPLVLDTAYAQSNEFNQEGQQSFRVHAIKRNGKIEVVPFATRDNASSVPYVYPGDQVSEIEAAAIASVEENFANLPEGRVVASDVTIGKDGPVVSQTESVDSSLIPGTPNATPPSPNEYVNAAIYAALKGRTPAFAMQARRVLRERAIADRAAQEKTEQAKATAETTPNKDAFKAEFYKQFPSSNPVQLEQLWQAVRDKNDAKAKELIGMMVANEEKAAVPAQIMPANQKLIDESNDLLRQLEAQAAESSRVRKSKTQRPAENLNEVYSIPESQDGTPMTTEQVQAVVDELTGGSANVTVINNYDKPFAGRITNRRDIQLNAARIRSVEHAREVLMEEAIHAVWNDAGIQDAWAGIKATASKDEVLEIQQHYANHGVEISYATAVEEWANREVRRKYLQESGPVKSFIDRIWQAIKDMFGLAAPENASDASRIMHRALEYLSEEAIKNSRLKPASPANAYVFSNGQVAGPSSFYILATHSNRGLFDPTGRNPLGEFDHKFMSSGEGQQTYGWGTYLGSGQGTTDFYRNFFAKETAGVDPAFDTYTDQIINVGLEQELRSLWLNYSNEDFVAGMVLAQRKNTSKTGLITALEALAVEKEVADQNRYLQPEDQMSVIINYDTLEKINKSIEKHSRGSAATLQVRFNATPDVLLDHDASFEEHSPEIKSKLEKAYPNFFSAILFSPDSPRFGESFYSYLERTLGSPKLASEALYRLGIKGIQFLDGGSRQNQSGTRNYVAFSESDMEIMSDENTGLSFSLDSAGNMLRADQELYSIPEQTKAEKKRQRQRERLSRLKRLKIEDKYDGNTKTLTNLLRKIKAEQVEQLSDQHVEDFYDLVDHLYQARTNKIQTPDIREDSSVLIDELRQYRRLLDMMFIQSRIKEMGDVMDLTGYKGAMDDRESFEAYENQLAKENKLDLNKGKGNNEAWEKKQENWREKFREAVSDFLTTLPTADAWIEDIEALNGRKFKSEKQKEMMRMHHRYMTEVVDPSTLEGPALYNHFHEINNMLDGQSIYLPETSIAWIAGVRDSGINIYDLKGKFRDPVILRNEFLKGMDIAQRTTELKQTQLSRFSAFTEGKDWLQNDLMGPLLDSILRESANHQADSNARYLAAKKVFEKNTGRKMTSEDTISMAMTSRLIQFPVEQDPNVAFRHNLANEQQAISNMIASGSRALELEAKTIYQPMLDRLVKGLEKSSVPMEDFMASMNDRLGLGFAAIGKQRMELLSQMQELMDEYSLDSQFISEAFYKKPFKAYANYMPRRALSIAPEKLNAREHDIAQEIATFDDNWYKSNGMTAETEQLKTRSRIGDNAYYSNNIEYLFDRGIRISSLTASTTAERFILSRRLRKGGVVHELIQGSDKAYRVNQLQEWASSLFLNAMHSGTPLGSIGQWMRRFNELYARVALSGLHQGVTQSMSGFSDYHIRTGNITGAMQAAQFLINKGDKVDAWFRTNASRISNRSLLGEQELNRQRSPSIDESAISKMPMMKALEGYYEGATKIITFSLRKGDDFTAKSLVLAEYARMLRQKGHKFKGYADMDWDVVDGPALTQAMLNVERNINSSDKITRGELFTDRTWGLSLFRNLALAFSSHTMILAAQFNQSVRDLIDLKAQGASKDKMAEQVKTIGAIIGQTFVFSSSRFAINAGMATVMIGMLRELFDDEEGKLAELQENLDYARKTGDDTLVQAAEAELSEAKAIRDSINNFQNRNTSFTAYYQGVLKEQLGSIHFAFGGPGLPQKLIFPVADTFGEKMYKESVKAEANKLKLRIEKEKKSGNFTKAAKLSEDLYMLESVEYLPLNIEQFGNIGLGGITGTSLSATYASWKEVNSAANGLTEYNWNDVLLAAQSAGIGQADVNRYFKTVDKIEDALYKKGKESEEQRKKAAERQAAQEERASERRLRTLLNQIK